MKWIKYSERKPDGGLYSNICIRNIKTKEVIRIDSITKSLIENTYTDYDSEYPMEWLDETVEQKTSIQKLIDNKIDEIGKDSLKYNGNSSKDSYNRTANQIKINVLLELEKELSTIETPEIVKEILICDNCKRYWEAPKEKCVCGSNTLTKTHPSNITQVEKEHQEIVNKSLEEAAKETASNGGPFSTHIQNYRHMFQEGAEWQKKQIVNQGEIIAEIKKILYLVDMHPDTGTFLIKSLDKLSKLQYSRKDMEAAYLQGHKDTYESEYYGNMTVKHFYCFEEFITNYKKK